MTHPSSTSTGTIAWEPQSAVKRASAPRSLSTSYSTKSQPSHSSRSRTSAQYGQLGVAKSSSDIADPTERVAQRVIDRGLRFLDARDVIAANDDGAVGQDAAH